MSDAGTSELYQSIILDHNRRPHNFGELAGANRTAEGHNPLCGDELTVWVRLDGERIEDVRFVGRGCAISKASASLMTDAVKGKTREEAESLFRQFHELVTSRAAAESPLRELGKLRVFSGVARFPIRVKCASLPWHTLRSALAGETAAPVSTE